MIANSCFSHLAVSDPAASDPTHNFRSRGQWPQAGQLFKLVPPADGCTLRVVLPGRGPRPSRPDPAGGTLSGLFVYPGFGFFMLGLGSRQGLGTLDAVHQDSISWGWETQPKVKKKQVGGGRGVRYFTTRACGSNSKSGAGGRSDADRAWQRRPLDPRRRHHQRYGKRPAWPRTCQTRAGRTVAQFPQPGVHPSEACSQAGRLTERPQIRLALSTPLVLAIMFGLSFSEGSLRPSSASTAGRAGGVFGEQRAAAGASRSVRPGTASACPLEVPSMAAGNEASLSGAVQFRFGFRLPSDQPAICTVKATL